VHAPIRNAPPHSGQVSPGSPKLDMASYSYLPRVDVDVETTSAASYMALMAEAAE